MRGQRDKRDLLRRNFSAPAPNQKRCGDIAGIPTDEGKLYLAWVPGSVRAAFAGCPMSDHPDAKLAYFPRWAGCVVPGVHAVPTFCPQLRVNKSLMATPTASTSDPYRWP
jgi:hypothetical protein